MRNFKFANLDGEPWGISLNGRFHVEPQIGYMTPCMVCQRPPQRQSDPGWVYLWVGSSNSENLCSDHWPVLRRALLRALLEAEV